MNEIYDALQWPAMVATLALLQSGLFLVNLHGLRQNAAPIA